MSKGFAKVQVMGNLGADPVLNTVGKDEKKIDVLNCKVAVNVDEKTVQWYSVELWGKRAKAGKEFLKKGSKVFISDGDLLEPNSWKTNEGEERIEMKIRVNEWHWLDGKKEEKE